MGLTPQSPVLPAALSGLCPGRSFLLQSQRSGTQCAFPSPAEPKELPASAQALGSCRVFLCNHCSSCTATWEQLDLWKRFLPGSGSTSPARKQTRQLGLVEPADATAAWSCPGIFTREPRLPSPLRPHRHHWQSCLLADSGLPSQSRSYSALIKFTLGTLPLMSPASGVASGFFSCCLQGVL